MSKLEVSRAKTSVAVQPQHGRHHHLSYPSQEERIRSLFGLPPKSPLPSVSEEKLTRYFQHLVENLAIPFQAIYCQTSGEMRQLIHYVHVLELTDPRRCRQSALHDGLSCKAQNSKDVIVLPLAELGVREEDPNCQLLDDYAYWFVNWR